MIIKEIAATTELCAHENGQDSCTIVIDVSRLTWTYLQHADFPHGDLLDERILITLHELFDGHSLAGVSVATFEDNSIRTLTNLHQLIILVHIV